MGANDVKPTRLLAADAALTQFMNRLPSKYRVALITFASGIAVKVAPTYDHSVVIKALPMKAQLDGTAMGDALAEAVTVAKRAVGPSKPGAPHPPPQTFFLVSDGGSNAGKTTPEQAATLAKKAAIPGLHGLGRGPRPALFIRTCRSARARRRSPWSRRCRWIRRR